MKKAISPLFQIGLCTFGYLYATCDTTLAQVTSDNTVNTQVNQNGNVAEITGGTTRDINLFHSFQEFSVPTGNQAFFNNATDISNIFSRVTGGKVSNIDGLIRANGDASLFLINPAGIIFGEGARLDIGGSFYGSSASSILFEDGEFSAVDLENPPLLTVKAPVGLSFRDNPGDIINRSTANNNRGLEVEIGNNIALLGGGVNFDRGNIIAPGGNVFLGGLRSDGDIVLEDNNSLSFPNGNTLGDVFIANSSVINVRAGEGGTILVNANNFELTSGSLLFAGITQGLGAENAQAGDIIINTVEDVVIDGLDSENLTGIANLVGENSIGNGGNVEISARNISFANDGLIFNTSSGQGNVGDINLTATENISLDGNDNPQLFVGIQNNIANTGQGNAGQINLTATNLSFTNGALVSSLVLGTGNSSNININVSDTISIDGLVSINDGILNSGISSRVGDGSEGNSGNINITTSNLNLTNGGAIAGNNLARGDSGDIVIDADLISIDGKGSVNDSISTISTSIFGLDEDRTSIGDGGDIKITTNELFLTNGGLIQAVVGNEFTEGNGGDINISATNSISLNGSAEVDNDFGIVGSGITTSVQGGVGNAGTITLETPNLSVTNGAQIRSFTRGLGDAGTIDIQAFDSVIVDNDSLITVRTEDEGQGNAGNILIDTTQLTVSNSSEIEADTLGEGNGGSIVIKSSDSVNLTDVGQISAIVEESAIGDGGNIILETNKLDIQNTSAILASTFGKGNAGDITLSISESINLSTTGIVAAIVGETGTGNAGDLRIDTQDLTIVNESQILGDTFGEGSAGSVFIRATDSIELAGNASFISAGVESEATGNGGDLDIQTGQLTILDNGEITVESLGTGQAGELTIQANSIQLNDGRIDAATPIGNGGSVTLNVFDDVTLQGDSFISARALNDANGGNLNIDSRFIIAYPNGNNDILASAEQGRGGNITIDAESLFGIRERTPSDLTNDINASSEVRGLDGTVDIITPDVNPLQGATELPNNVVVPEQTTTQACQANREAAAQNGLTIKGKGGVPPAPHLPLNSHNITINGENTDSTASIPQPIETSQGKIQPARGIKVTEDGRVILTAYRTNNQGDRLSPESINCDRV